MRDFWDRLAQWLGYDYFDWGVAADWFAAVGTVGAFGLTAWIILRDKRRDLQRLADGLVSWLELKRVKDDEGELVFEVTVHVHNSTDMPFPRVVLHEKKGNSGTYILRRFTPVNGSPVRLNAIAARQAGIARFGKFPTDKIPDLYLEFRDANGVEWWREVGPNKYVKPIRPRISATEDSTWAKK